MRHCGLLILLAGSCLAQIKTVDPFSGTFQGDQVVLELKPDGSAYAGTLRVQDVALPVTASVKFGILGGSFTIQGRKTTFTAMRSASGLTLMSGNETYQLVRTTNTVSATPATEAPRSSSGLVGSWRAPQGSWQFNADGTAMAGGYPYRYTIEGDTVTMSGSDGVFKMPFQLNGDSMTVTLQGRPIALTRVKQDGGPGGVKQELAGKWCYLSNVNANNGARASSSCFVLNPDGTYQYSGQTDSYNPYGGATSQSSDSGTWTATETTLTANSRTRGPTVYQMEKRNHPKNNDPMLVINGQAFVTFYQKTPW